MLRSFSPLAPLLLLLAGCLPAPDEPTAPARSATLGELILEPCTYEVDGQRYSARCGWLGVPENRRSDDSSVLQLPVIRVAATGGEPLEPIYYLSGGPGQTNLQFAHLGGLIERHDLVLVGYRGVDGPVRLDCPEVGQVLVTPPGALLSEETWEATADAYGRCAERWTKEGVDLRGYDLEETVDDLEAVRNAFGDQSVEILSESYGTRLAMIWIWKYPKSSRRSLLVGVNPPGHFVWRAETTDRLIDRYSQLCAEDAACSARTEDLAAAMRRVSAAMPAQWGVIPIERDSVLLGSFLLLYHTTTAPQVFDAWLDADEGDSSGLAALSLVARALLATAPVVWGQSAAMATSSDYFYEAGRDYLAELLPEGSILGAPASPAGFAAAKGWPSSPIAERFLQVQPSSSEMLLVSGNLDFSTPVEAARDELLPALANGRQVILRDFGHTEDFWRLQPEATSHLLTTWFATGGVDDSKFERHRVDFRVPLGLGDIAKIVLAALVVVGLVALLMLRWGLARLARPRRAAPGAPPSPEPATEPAHRPPEPPRQRRPTPPDYRPIKPR